MNTDTNAVIHDNNAQFDPYEKLINVFLLSLEVVKINQLYNDFCANIEDRNRLEITVIFDRILFDYIVINWAKICGPHSETLHFYTVFREAGYSVDLVRDDFLKAIELSYEEYQKMHSHLLTWRNKIIAHFDFNKAYNLTLNAEYFSKIQPQCRSIAESVIKAFIAAGQKYPDFKCGVHLASKNFKLIEIAQMLQQIPTNYPIGFSSSKWKAILQELVKS